MLLKNSVISLFSNVLTRSVTFLLTVYFAQNLNKSDFGFLMIIRNTVAMLDQVVSSSVGNALISEISKGNRKDNLENVAISLVINILLIFIIIGIYFLYLLGVGLGFIGSGTYVFNGSNLILAMGLLFFALLSVHIQKMQIGLALYKLSLVCSLFSVLIFSVLFLVAITWGSNTVGYGVGTFLTYFIIDSIVRLRSLNIQLFDLFRTKNLSSYWKNIVSFVKNVSLLALSAVVSAAFFWFIKILYLNFENGIEIISDFEVSYIMVGFMLVFTGVIVNVSTQSIASNFGKKGEGTLIVKSILLNVFVVLLFSIFFFFISPFFYNWLGENYSFNLDSFAVSIVYALLVTIQAIFNRVLIIYNEFKYILISIILSSFCSFSVFYFQDSPSVNNIYVVYSIFLSVFVFLGMFKYYKISIQ